LPTIASGPTTAATGLMTAASGPTTAAVGAGAGAAATKAPAGGGLMLRKEEPRPIPTLRDDSGSGGVIRRMASYAIVILLLGGGAVVLARKYFRRLAPAAAGGGQKVRVVDSIHVGPGKQVLVLEAGSQRFLVASCKDRVNLISELTGSFAEVYQERSRDDSDEAAGSAKESQGGPGSA
jgi:flagellar biogenesis protein FliO